MPVLEGFWKQHEIWDGTYILTDLLDIHEAMLVYSGNKEILLESERRKAEDEARMNRKRF